MKVCMYTKALLSGGVTVKKAPETTQFRCSLECGQHGPWKYEHTHTGKQYPSLYKNYLAEEISLQVPEQWSESNQTMQICNSSWQGSPKKWGIILCHQWHNHKSEMCWLFEISWKRKFHHLLLVTALSNEVAQDFSLSKASSKNQRLLL